MASRNAPFASLAISLIVSSSIFMFSPSITRFRDLVISTSVAFLKGITVTRDLMVSINFSGLVVARIK